MDSSGTLRAYLRLKSRSAFLDRLFASTPRRASETRQVIRRAHRVAAKAEAARRRKDAVKSRRSRKRAVK